MDGLVPLTILIPFVDRYDLTFKCLESIWKTTEGPHDIVLVDNGSTEVGYLGISPGQRVRLLQPGENLGPLGALRYALPRIDTELLVFMHNDVLIHERGWDLKVRDAFGRDPLLALAGLFGAPGVGKDGGRMDPASRMLGKEWGTGWEVHGRYLEQDVMPAAVLDSLFLVFRTNLLKEVGIPPEWPPHHWYDRLFPLVFIERGLHVAVLGIDFDHHGGGSTGERYDRLLAAWSDREGVPTIDDSLHCDAMYARGYKVFSERFGERLPLKVLHDFTPVWFGGPTPRTPP